MSLKPSVKLPAKKEKILIIEGDTKFADHLMSTLKSGGYENVHLVKNGIDGLKSMYDRLPHLILLDVMLPGMDGYKILAAKHAETLLSKIPVFLMSAQGVSINMQSVPQGSVTEFITALHANPEEIMQKINRYFDHDTGSSVNPITQGDADDGKKKVLWIEDDKLIGAILVKKLVSSGLAIYHAKNGEEAIKILKDVRPDGIVIDLLLPGMSGFDILQMIKVDSRLAGVPTMVLSNLSKPSDIERAKALGARKFLVKAATSLDQIVLEIKELCN